MRDAINNNPKVQIGVIGALVLIVGLFFMMNMSKKSSSSSPASTASSTSAGGTTAPVTAAGGSATAGAVPPATAGAIPPSVPSVAAGPSTPSATVTPEALVPGPGLPRPVVEAWKGGDAIVLLVVRGGGIDDRLVRRSVDSLSGDPGVSVFVAPSEDVARYSRIAQGVGLDRTPALIVVRPRRESGSVPQAQVSYGFRSSQGVVQSVHDALYSGRDDLPYSPR